jgi:hypothetical protein
VGDHPVTPVASSAALQQVHPGGAAAAPQVHPPVRGFHAPIQVVDGTRRGSPEGGGVAVAQRRGMTYDRSKVAPGAPTSSPTDAPPLAPGRRPLTAQAQRPAPPPLPQHVLQQIEDLGGPDMIEIRPRSGAAQPAQLAALAYGQGTSIAMPPGADHHLAHEAAHVVQQRGGRVAPTAYKPGGLGDTPDLEAEADALGAAAMRGVMP